MATSLCLAESVFCAGTYQKILAAIAKPALKNAEIKFSTTVVKINSSDRIGGKVALTTENGEKFHFDEVVVTAPLGWLKQNQDAFVPPLPPRLSQAIDSIGYGCLEKVRNGPGTEDPTQNWQTSQRATEPKYIN
jgi:monoamine oxidase